MDPLQALFCLLGAFFLICNFVDLDNVMHKAKKMKFDPDWINFMFGTILILFSSVLAIFFIRSILE